MGTVVDKIQYTLTAVNDIVDALTEKGFDIEHLYNINDYGRLIRQIKGGTGSDVKIYGGMEAVKLEFTDTFFFSSSLVDCQYAFTNRDETEIIFKETDFIETPIIPTSILLTLPLEFIETIDFKSSLIESSLIESKSTEFPKMINMETDYVDTIDKRSDFDRRTFEKTEVLNSTSITKSSIEGVQKLGELATVITADCLITKDITMTFESAKIKKDFVNVFIEYYLYTKDKLNYEFIDYSDMSKKGFKMEYIDTTEPISEFKDYTKITME